VANHQKRTLETQFAKTYRTLQTAVNLAIAEHGDIGTWDWKEGYTPQEKDDFTKKYLLPYLNVAKFCSTSDPNAGCFPDVDYLMLDGSIATPRFSTYNTPKALLADGTAIEFNHYFNWNKNNALAWNIRVDVNGHKKPNVIGRDMFAFNFYPQTNEFLPCGVYLERSYDVQTGKFARVEPADIDVNCGEGGIGWWCAVKIINDGFKMNY